MKSNFKLSLTTKFISLVLAAIISSSATILADTTIASSNNNYIETFNDIIDTPPVKH